MFCHLWWHDGCAKWNKSGLYFYYQLSSSNTILYALFTWAWCLVFWRDDFHYVTILSDFKFILFPHIIGKLTKPHNLCFLSREEFLCSLLKVPFLWKVNPFFSAVIISNRSWWLDTCLCLIFKSISVLRSRDFHSKSESKRNSSFWKPLTLNSKCWDCAGVISLLVSLNLESNWLTVDGVMTSSSPSMFLSSSFLPTIVSYLLFSLYYNLFILQFPLPTLLSDLSR